MQYCTEYYPAKNVLLYLDQACVVTEFQLLVSEEHQQQFCANPIDNKIAVLKLFRHDVTGVVFYISGGRVVGEGGVCVQCARCHISRGEG